VRLIVGLGNPGQEYRWTRHNMGFLVLEHLAKKEEIQLARRRFQAVFGPGRIARRDVILAKPLTYMNLSGEAVGRLLRFFHIPPEDLIVVHDDLDLPFGKLRIRVQGGHGGHQGVKSIIECVGSNEFIRLKIGIGRPGDPRQDPADYVLAPLTREEREEVKDTVDRGAEVIGVLLSSGPQEAMNRFHKDGGE
jgi:peptidyl-tRNA hydrolase, PTH1 family